MTTKRQTFCRKCGALRLTVMGPCNVCGTSVDRRYVVEETKRTRRRIRYCALFFAALTFVMGTETWIFVLTAQHTIGRVTDLKAFKRRCGGGEGGPAYDCWLSEVGIGFTAGSTEHSLIVGVGQDQGGYRVGEAVPVMFDPHNPVRAYLPIHFGFLY